MNTSYSSIVAPPGLWRAFRHHLTGWTQPAALLLCSLALVSPLDKAKAADDTNAAAKAEAAHQDIAGIYTLVSVNGKDVPAALNHEGATLEVRSGSFEITADGKCVSQMIFLPPSRKEVTNYTYATFTRKDRQLKLRWKGAGMTLGVVEGKSFTMTNEDMVLTYRLPK